MVEWKFARTDWRIEEGNSVSLYDAGDNRRVVNQRTLTNDRAFRVFYDSVFMIAESSSNKHKYRKYRKRSTKTSAQLGLSAV